MNMTRLRVRVTFLPAPLLTTCLQIGLARSAVLPSRSFLPPSDASRNTGVTPKGVRDSGGVGKTKTAEGGKLFRKDLPANPCREISRAGFAFVKRQSQTENVP